ncbi:hypothetical protein hamaS1_20120 [Moorella sp. Hama-1]|nr:hypothetical protein hamaS1_20120 [Moorella sp. Hama-1]
MLPARVFAGGPNYDRADRLAGRDQRSRQRDIAHSLPVKKPGAYERCYGKGLLRVDDGLSPKVVLYSGSAGGPSPVIAHAASGKNELWIYCVPKTAGSNMPGKKGQIELFFNEFD